MMDAIVTIKFTFENVCNKEDLEDITFKEMVESLIEDNGLGGLFCYDKYEVLSVEEAIK